MQKKLIAHGLYRDPCPLDPLEQILFEQDNRFVDAGLNMIALAERWTAEDEFLAEERRKIYGGDHGSHPASVTQKQSSR